MAQRSKWQGGNLLVLPPSWYLASKHEPIWNFPSEPSRDGWPLERSWIQDGIFLRVYIFFNYNSAEKWSTLSQLSNYEHFYLLRAWFLLIVNDLLFHNLSPCKFVSCSLPTSRGIAKCRNSSNNGVLNSSVLSNAIF